MTFRSGELHTLPDMRSLLTNPVALLVLCISLLPATYARIFSGSAMEGMADAVNFQLDYREAMMQNFPSFGPHVPASHIKRDAPPTFSNPRAEQFFVDGSKLPLGGFCSRL
jgi:hypothetical protein